MSDTTAACAWANFRRPRLGRFKQQEAFAFKKQLGCGIDGIVWKVDAGGQEYALKVFWDNSPPEGTRYWAVQRECHNASLLERMRYVIEHSPDPIWLNPEPKTSRDAALNLHAFSDEGRTRKLFQEKPDAVKYTAVPHLRKCYGWTMVSGKELRTLPWKLRPVGMKVEGEMREISPDEEYHAIVYECVSGNDLNAEAVQAQLDFFWLTGFCMVPLRAENWKGNRVLVDMADLICPWHVGWYTDRYNKRDAKWVMEQCP